MSQVTGRINLSARAFPFVSQNWGRTVIVSSSADTNFNRQVQASTDVDHDVGVPQAYYMHNIMPHAQGYQSIGYDQIIAASATTGELFENIQQLRDDLGNFALLGICANGDWFVWRSAVLGWTIVGKFPAFAQYQVYTAYVNGTTYIYQKGHAPQHYSWTGDGGLDTDAFTAIDYTSIVGICTSFGYLIAWSDVTPVADFNVSTIAGNAVFTANNPSQLPIPRVGDNLVSLNLTGGSGNVLAVGTNSDGTLVNFTLDTAAVNTTTSSILTRTAAPGAVYWSSTIDPLDFVPSLLTGAGGGEVQAALGAITFCVSHTKGFIVYTTQNSVGGTYSGNARYPFDFQAIVGSGGISDYNLITQEGDTGNHYAYTTNGLQLVSMGAATTTLTDLTDFISGKLFEDFDQNTAVFTVTKLLSTMVKKICIVASRYLVMSYGITSLTHAIVYDLITTRYGKLKQNHVACFEVPPAVVGVITDLPRQSIGLLQQDGTCLSVSFDVLDTSSNGCLVIGKFQYVRARNLILDEVVIEDVYDNTEFTLRIMTSLYGKTITSVVAPVLGFTSGQQNKYLCRQEGQNHSLLLTGQFHIESGLLVFNVGGKR